MPDGYSFHCADFSPSGHDRQIAAGCGDKAQVAGDKRKVDDKASTAAVTSARLATR